MANILIFLEHFERIAILVTIIVILTKIVKEYIMIVTMKRMIAAIYELFGGIAPDYDPLEAVAEFPVGKEAEHDDSGVPE